MSAKTVSKDKKASLQDLAKVIHEEKKNRTPAEKAKDKRRHKQRQAELTESARLERAKKRQAKPELKRHATLRAEVEATRISRLELEDAITDDQVQERDNEIMAARAMAGLPIDTKEELIFGDVHQ